MYTPHLPQLFNPGVVLNCIIKAPILHTIGEVWLCIHGKVSRLHIMAISQVANTSRKKCKGSSLFLSRVCTTKRKHKVWRVRQYTTKRWHSLTTTLGKLGCLVPRPHSLARSKRFGSRVPYEKVRPRQKFSKTAQWHCVSHFKVKNTPLKDTDIGRETSWQKNA